jgi:Opioid growth factor receptor (OGFr) conserved region
MMILAYNSTTPLFNTSTYLSHNCLERICKTICNLAIQMFKAICSYFGRPARLASVSTGESRPLNLIPFYRGQEANNNHVTLEQILAWDDTRLESVHDYIQWLFPLKTMSGPNPSAPVLDDATILTFQNDPILKNQVLRSFRRMLTFYGLQMGEGTKVISRAANFNARASVWLYNSSGHHNFLRITRILHSMNLLGLGAYCKPFLNILVDIRRNEGKNAISETTLGYWEAAERGAKALIHHPTKEKE